MIMIALLRFSAVGLIAAGCLADPLVADPPGSPSACAFPADLSYAVATRPRSVAVGDLDGDLDLDLDLAVTYVGFGGGVAVLLDPGDGTFPVAGSYGAGLGPVAVATGDLDGDLDLDLAVANSGSGTVSVLLGQCAGQRTRCSLVLLPLTQFRAPRIHRGGPRRTAEQCSNRSTRA